MTLINPLLGSNFSSKFDTTLIEDSVWLDGTADYMDTTFSSGSVQSKIVYACWLKRNDFARLQSIFTAHVGGRGDRFGFQADDTIDIHLERPDGSTIIYSTSNVFRDIGWYHFILSIDLNQTQADAVKLYVNGVENDVTVSYGPSAGALTTMSSFGNAGTHAIGKRSAASDRFSNTYQTQCTFLVGKSIQAENVAVTDFLKSFEFGTKNGSQFGPKSNAAITALAADAGTNSFALDFSDSSYLGHDSRPHNFLTYSEQLDQWINFNTVRVANALVAPDGSQTADTIAQGTGSTYPQNDGIRADATLLPSTLYTFSGHFKHSQSNTTGLHIGNYANSPTTVASIFYTWSGGSPTLDSSTNASNIVLTDVGNGWHRLSFSFTTFANASQTNQFYLYPRRQSAEGTDVVGMWGMQVEQGTLGTYVPTPKNLLRMTEDFTTVGYWGTHSNFTKTADQTIAPDGTNTADLLTKTATAGGWIGQTPTVQNRGGATTLTFSCFAKKSVGNYFALRTQSPYPDRMDAVFNIDTGEVHNTSVTNFTNISASITDEGNGWYRCSVTGTTPSSTGSISNSSYVSCNSNGGFLSDTDSVSNSAVFVWGAQLEYGTAVTSYVKKTTTNAVNVVPNNFTPNSITAVNQSTNTPSLEFATLNPLNGDATLVAALEYGNRLGVGNSDWDSVFATKSMGRTGKYYYEVRVHTNTSSNGFPAGIHEENTTSKNWANYIGNTTATYGLGYGLYSAGDSNSYYTNGSGANLSDYSGALAAGDIVMMAVDLDNSKIWWGKNGTFFNGNPSSNTNGVSIQTNTDYVFGISPSASEDYFVNFGADSTFGGAISAGGNSDSKGVGNFKYAVPTDFLSLASAALDTPELQGADNFSVTLGTEEAVAPSENINPYSENATLNYTTVQSTTITNNFAPDPNGILTADKIEDTSTSATQYTQKNLSIPAGKDTYTWSFYIRKDENTSRIPLFYMGLYNGSLGNQIKLCWFNTSTGAIQNGSGASAYTSLTSESAGDYWKISLTVTNNGENTLIYTQVYPAGASSMGSALNGSLTGSVVFAHSQIVQNAPSVLPIDDSNSTVTGNMTNGGGLSAIFDGDTTKNNSESASGVNTNANDSFVIVDHGSPKNVAAFTAFASTDAQGFDGDSGSSIITFTLAGSTDNFSSSNVTLFSDTTGDGAGKVHAINANSTSGSERITLGAYRYHKMTVQTNTVNSGQKYGQLAQLQFFESTTPATYIPTYKNTPASLPYSHKLNLIDGTTTENYIRNNTMEGASAGTPGTAPTGWIVIGNGTTVQLVGSGVTDDGIEYVDYKFSGTPTHDPWMTFEDGASIPALAGEEWTSSAYVALIAGSLTNLVSTQEIGLQTIGRNSGGSYVNFTGQLLFTPTSALVRQAFTATLSGATVTRVSNKFIINWDGSGAIDATFRIGNPQMEKRSHASQVIKTNQYTMNHNLALQSQTMDNATWVKSGCAVSTNVAVAPDGTTTAEGIQALNSSSSEKRVQQGIASVPSGTYVTASFYVKAARLSFVAVTVYDSISRVVRKFVNLSNGAIGSDTGGNNPQEPTFNVESVGNGWYRISAGQRTVGSGTVTMRVQPAASDGNLAYSASESNVDEIYVWGAQFEKTFNSPRTYLPTTTAAVFEPTKRTSLNSFVEIQKNRTTSETWAWRFSHDYDKEYAVSTSVTHQDIRDQTGTDNWVNYALKIAAESGTAAGAVSHGFATGDTVVTHGLTSSRYAVFLFPRGGISSYIFVYHPDEATNLLLNSSAFSSADRITNVTSTSFNITSSGVAVGPAGVYDYLVLDDNKSGISLGSFVGNNSANGPYISTGHRPRLIIIKSMTTARDWVVFDTARDPDNFADSRIDFSTAGAEFAAALDIDILADGFKPRSTDIDGNASGVSYAYISIGDIDGGGDLPPIYGR